MGFCQRSMGLYCGDSFRGGIVGAGWEVERKRGVDGVEVALDLGTII